jgi:hypothetical protein
MWRYFELLRLPGHDDIEALRRAVTDGATRW